MSQPTGADGPKGLCVDIRVPNQTQYLALVGSIGEDVARNLEQFEGDKSELAFQLNLALTEASANAMEHAHAGDPEKFVRICISITDDCFEAEVHDEGQGFDISQLPEAEGDEPVERGRGIFLMRTFMDSVSYQRSEGGGNVLRMVKRLK